MERDPYEVLGISPDTSLAEAHAAYRRLAAIYHPDRLEGSRPDVQAEATVRMTALNDAWDQVRRTANPEAADTGGPNTAPPNRDTEPEPRAAASSTRPAARTPESVRSPSWIAEHGVVVGAFAFLAVVVAGAAIMSQPDDESASTSLPAETQTTTTLRAEPTTTVELPAPSTTAVVATVPPPPGLPEAPWDAPAVSPPADLAEAASIWASSPFPGCSLYAPTRMASDAGYTPAFFPQFTRIGGFDIGWDGPVGNSVWMTVWPSDNQNISQYYDDPAPEIFSDGSERRRVESPLLIDSLISIPGEPCVYQVSCDSMVECDWIFSSFRRITT